MMNSLVEEVGEDNVIQAVIDNAEYHKVVGQMLMAKRKRRYFGYLVLHIVLT